MKFGGVQRTARPTNAMIHFGGARHSVRAANFSLGNF
jgi:hypothetical protein